MSSIPQFFSRRVNWIAYWLFYLLIIKSTDGYPNDIDIGLQVVVYLADNEGNVFCTAVLISINKVLATNNCLSEKNIKTEDYYALVGSKESENRTRIKIIDLSYVPPFNVLIVSSHIEN